MLSNYHKHQWLLAITLFSTTFLLVGCASGPGAGPDTDFTSQTGLASFYADRFDGRQTASGEIFDQEKLTAAHKTLPFDTKVRVTNQANGKQVMVRINDRGPFVEGRIIDLSLAAARRLDFVQQGVVKVRIDVLNEERDF